METLKNEIKKLAETQSVLRDQRKSVHNKLERTIAPSEATWKHKANREKLRLMYAAYAILKGKTLEEVHEQNPTKDITNKYTILQCKAQIEKIVKQHIDEKVVRISE
jgi:hypothetical protein